MEAPHNESWGLGRPQGILKRLEFSHSSNPAPWSMWTPERGLGEADLLSGEKVEWGGQRGKRQDRIVRALFRAEISSKGHREPSGFEAK